LTLQADLQSALAESRFMEYLTDCHQLLTNDSLGWRVTET